MAEIAGPCLLLGSLAIQPHFGAGGRLMCLGAPALALAVAGLVASSALGRLLAARTIALVRGLCLQRRAVNGEVIGGKQPAARLFYHLFQQLARRIGLQQLLAELARRIGPCRKPSEGST